MQISRKNILDAIYNNEKQITHIDNSLQKLISTRDALERQNKRLKETLKALQNEDRNVVEVVELDYRNLEEIPGSKHKAWIGVSRLVMFSDKYEDLDTRQGELVAVRVDKMKYVRSRMNIKLSRERVVRGLDKNGFEVIEYTQRAYIDSKSYDTFYLQAKGKWEHEDMIRSGLKLRLVD